MRHERLNANQSPQEPAGPETDATELDLGLSVGVSEGAERVLFAAVVAASAGPVPDKSSNHPAPPESGELVATPPFSSGAASDFADADADAAGGVGGAPGCESDEARWEGQSIPNDAAEVVPREMGSPP